MHFLEDLLAVDRFSLYAHATVVRADILIDRPARAMALNAGEEVDVVRLA